MTRIRGHMKSGNTQRITRPLLIEQTMAWPCTEGVTPWRFNLHAWDPDDAFQSCHHNGEARGLYQSNTKAFGKYDHIERYPFGQPDHILTCWMDDDTPGQGRTLRGERTGRPARPAVLRGG